MSRLQFSFYPDMNWLWATKRAGMDLLRYNLYLISWSRNLTHKDWLGGALGKHWQRSKGCEKSEPRIVFFWVSSMLSCFRVSAFIFKEGQAPLVWSSVHNPLRVLIIPSISYPSLQVQRWKGSPQYQTNLFAFLEYCSYVYKWYLY